MSIIDEKITVPQDITTLLTAYSSLSPATLIRATGSQQPIGSTLIPTTSTPTDQPTATAVNHFFPPLPVLPPRMCTVSHCHKILPGHYMFKRCEQHRLQNRHHSKLKRVREKVVKSAGPPEGSIGETFEQGREDSIDPEDEKIQDAGVESEAEAANIPFMADKEVCELVIHQLHVSHFRFVQFRGGDRIAARPKTVTISLAPVFGGVCVIPVGCKGRPCKHVVERKLNRN
ncbi:uncharacterized protein BT62DRAFT_701843 [Guyanagaster necrorhizus]|uniref:Uncharacterized protein n=1 Tax=Guyanagaster necrorhizus TaxID=856835 RepID=A0A9P8AUS6_9AGAR|nr:uncharacterized protein BT62DRAFT_701843 [Guyanagaster necrorhizus MCA 3950]KAG7448371.1 hypothetical protein BT62DRAFT_701843 [Guyanagaster necrorhizus MCA 3950]